MQFFILALMGIVMAGEFLVGALNLPPILRFLPEAMSAILIVYVLFAGTRTRFQLIAFKYWLTFIAFGVVMACGVANNPAGAGPMLSGARFFFRAVPLFFLPAVLPQTDRQIMRQLKWLLFLGALQLPISAYQRWVTFERQHSSGDGVRGTLLSSGILSMAQICILLVLTGLFLKGRIGKWAYAVLFLILLLPTTINETKATVVFLPVGLFVTLIAGSEPQKRLRYALMGLASLVIFAAIFVPIYNKMEEFNPYKNEQDITNYFTNKKNIGRYMSSNVGGVGTKLDVRRGDSIVVPLQFLAKDPVTLAFGLGLGCVSPANFGKNFEGAYFDLFQKFLITSFTYFVLEVGTFGTLLIAVLFWMVFRDSLFVAHRDTGLIAAIAAGWTGVVALLVVGVTYNAFHEHTSITYLYGYFSGLICARCVQMKSGHDR